MSDDKKRAEKFPSGILGWQIGEIERKLPVGEPPPWPINAELSSVGKRTPRIDGRLKVTGGARYTSDIRLPGMLYGKIVRSPHAHARILSIDTSAAEKHPGVRAVHIVEHLLGSAVLRDPAQESQSKYPVVRYGGQPICALAALTQADADEASKLIKIEFEKLPFVVSVEEARKEGAPLVFPGAADQAGTAGGGGGPSGVPQKGNVRGPVKGGTFGGPRGDITAGFAAAEVVVEASYKTQVQTHSALETHGIVADYKPDMLTVYASTQGTGSVQNELAEIFQLPKSRVRVITEFMGGGFGAKFGAGNYGVLATHLSKKAGAPVRMMLDRKEEHLAVGNRPSSNQTLRIGAKLDGTLTALHLLSYGTAGTGTGAGAGGPAKNMYPCPNLLTEEMDVFTHAGPSAAFRAPGHPQGVFALEQAIDELSEKLKMDPIALRDKIDFDEDQKGKNVDSEARRVERKIGAEKIGWVRRRAPGIMEGPIKRGLGMAQSIWYRFVDLDASCEVRIFRDGNVALFSAVQDLGTGIRSALAQVVAEELGLKVSDIDIRIGDTNFPSGTASGGSKTTGSITPAARNAAYRVKQKLIEQIAPSLSAEPGSLVFKDGKVFSKSDPSKSISFKAAASRLRTEQLSEIASRSDDYGGFESARGRNRNAVGGYGGVQFAEVAVDVETGVIRVERVVAVHDCGRPLNPLALESQINGGILQGLSYALYEDRRLDNRTGLMVNANLEQYKIAGARETPLIEIVIIEEYRGQSSTDAGGIGEPATIPTAAAIANAVYNAIGVRIRELPMTPARVLEALSRLPKPQAPK